MKYLLSLILLTLLVPSISTAAPDSGATEAAATAPTAASSAPSTASQPSKEPKDISEAVAEGKSVVSDFKGGKWREAIAGCITLLIFLWRRFASKLIIGKVSSWWVGLITVLVGYLGSIPQALSSGSFSWSTFIWTGLLTSAEAMLLWQMVGQTVLPKVFGDHKAEEKPA